MTIGELDEKERDLFLQTNNIAGSIEERVRKLEDNGVFDAYKQVHSYYADLAPQNSEAMKRGLFLQWYALVEPSFLSGINDIDPQAEKRIIDSLNDQIGQNKVDSELYSMVSYYSGWEFAFDRFKDCANLKRLLESRLEYNFIIQQLKQSDLTHRGQMGIYWQSVIPID